MWLTKLQIAIIEQDTKKIDELVSNLPDFKTIDEMKSAQLLIKEALTLIHNLKKETSINMSKLKKHIDFLASTSNSRNSKRLNIFS